MEELVNLADRAGRRMRVHIVNPGPGVYEVRSAAPGGLVLMHGTFAELALAKRQMRFAEDSYRQRGFISTGRFDLETCPIPVEAPLAPIADFPATSTPVLQARIGPGRAVISLDDGNLCVADAVGDRWQINTLWSYLWPQLSASGIDHLLAEAVVLDSSAPDGDPIVSITDVWELNDDSYVTTPFGDRWAALQLLHDLVAIVRPPSLHVALPRACSGSEMERIVARPELAVIDLDAALPATVYHVEGYDTEA